MKNYYRILNVQKSSNNDEIKKAYIQVMLFWHPARNKDSNAKEKFIEINEAYNILIDASKRSVYDRLYDTFFEPKQEIAVFQEVEREYQIYEQWVRFERIKAEKLLKTSTDKILTNIFHFIDKYGLLILFLLMGISMLFALIIKK